MDGCLRCCFISSGVFVLAHTAVIFSASGPGQRGSFLDYPLGRHNIHLVTPFSIWHAHDTLYSPTTDVMTDGAERTVSTESLPIFLCPSLHEENDTPQTGFNAEASAGSGITELLPTSERGRSNALSRHVLYLSVVLETEDHSYSVTSWGIPFREMTNYSKLFIYTVWKEKSYPHVPLLYVVLIYC